MLGLESLGVRMERHCKNALELAKYLERHESVKWVNYAALPNDRYHNVCKKITNGHASGIISFGIKGGKEAGAKLVIVNNEPTQMDHLSDLVINRDISKILLEISL